MCPFYIFKNYFVYVGVFPARESAHRVHTVPGEAGRLTGCLEVRQLWATMCLTAELSSLSSPGFCFFKNV